MADMRISGGQIPPTAAPQRSDAAKAAQRAFFQAALQQASPASSAAPIRAVAEPRPGAPVTNRAAEPHAATTPPTRYARPGSLLDIKV